MRKILLALLIFIIHFLFINYSFWLDTNKWCFWPVHRPFDRIILFDKFNWVNSPRIKDYNLDNEKIEKLDNILSKISDDRKPIFLTNIEKIFKEKVNSYSENIKGYTKWWKKYYTDIEIWKIKLLYSLNFYFSNQYNKYDKLKETKVINDSVILDNWVKLDIKKISNTFMPELNCIQIYEWYNNIFESNDYNKELSFEIKLVNDNIFYISYKKIWNIKSNKILLKIYHIWVWRLTLQQPFYTNIVNSNDINNIINNIIIEYASKLKF